MTIENIGLFAAIGAKMDYLNQRQTVIAQNIANADTPGYIAKDLEEVDFKALVSKLTKQNSIQPMATNSSHISAATQAVDPSADAQDTAYEVSPSGNAVVMEEQIIKSSQTVTDYNLMVNLMRRNVSMVRMAVQGSN